METRFVPDVPATWLVYDLGAIVLALPSEFRSAADAIAARHAEAPAGVAAVLANLEASGIATNAPFAVLEAASGGVHVALRGPATVVAGDQTFTGLGSDPWLDRTVDSVGVARLTVPGGEWTFALTPAASGAPSPPVAAVTAVPDVPQIDSSEITAFPDVEQSLPPAPPPLGLVDEDDRTVHVSELPAAKGDADDKTVVVDEIAQLRAKRSGGLAPPVTPTSAPAASAPAVPKLSIELPDGSRQPLDAVVLVGRAPSAPAGGPPSRLVRLAGDGDISRNHARVAIEGGTVVVTDLGSRNGTIVRIPGRPAQKLREGEPTPVLVDTVIDFGGGIEVSVREG